MKEIPKEDRGLSSQQGSYSFTSVTNFRANMAEHLLFWMPVRMNWLNLEVSWTIFTELLGWYHSSI